MQHSQILVVDAFDDSGSPQIGEVIEWPDEDTVLVRWDGETQVRPEPMDALSPYRPYRF
jgi:hypothetical protein